MKNFFVISNIDRDPGQKKAMEICTYIKEQGGECGVLSMKRIGSGCEDVSEELSQIPENVECAIVLGGDGTIIQAAPEMARRNIPVIGINLGRLGFLAEIEYDDMIMALDKLIRDDYFLESRMMLEGTANVGGREVSGNMALNDIVITRTGAMRVVDYDVYVNDKLLTTINGDGVVISTPTGSTGYSMSAGGPIVEPGAMVILLTPISAHNLSSRPVVLSPDDEIKIQVVSSRYDDASFVRASFDGGKSFDMDKNDYIKISKAMVETKVLKISKESFLDVLSRKLSS